MYIYSPSKSWIKEEVDGKCKSRLYRSYTTSQGQDTMEKHCSKMQLLENEDFVSRDIMIYSWLCLLSYLVLTTVTSY